MDGAGGRVTLKPNAEVLHAQADRADDTLETWIELAEFLSTLLRDIRKFARLRHATEQASSSAVKDEDMNKVCEDECDDIVSEKIAEVVEQRQGRHFYGEQQLLLHKRMWDILTHNKANQPGEQSFSEWCRRVAMHSQTTSSSTGHAETTSFRALAERTALLQSTLKANSTATEHTETASFRASARADSTATVNAEIVHASFRALAEDILTNDLTREQVLSASYKLQQRKAITPRQLSIVKAILRKNLGDFRVVYFIFTHGVPTLLDPERAMWYIDGVSVQKDAFSRALLQNMLEEFMDWHSSLLQSILERQQDPDMTTARKLSDLEAHYYPNTGEPKRKRRPPPRSDEECAEPRRMQNVMSDDRENSGGSCRTTHQSAALPRAKPDAPTTNQLNRARPKPPPPLLLEAPNHWNTAWSSGPHRTTDQSLALPRAKPDAATANQLKRAHPKPSPPPVPDEGCAEASYLAQCANSLCSRIARRQPQLECLSLGT